MTGPTSEQPLDLTAVEADNRLLDTLASGGRPDPADPVAAALADLRGVLDAAYAGSDPLDLDRLERPARPRLARRSGLVAAAAVAVVVSLTGVAAAVGGEANPLQRVVRELVGAPLPDPYAVHADRALDQAAVVVDAGRARGWVTGQERSRVTGLLALARADARHLRDGDEVASRLHRADALAAALAALPAPTDGTTVRPEPGETEPASPGAGEDRETPSTTPEPAQSRSSEGGDASTPSPGATPRETDSAVTTTDGGDAGTASASPASEPSDGGG